VLVQRCARLWKGKYIYLKITGIGEVAYKVINVGMRRVVERDVEVPMKGERYKCIVA